MQLRPLVIALQGIGFGSLATAVQGFVDLQDELSKAGTTKGKKKRFPAWHWMPPLEPLRRPRKKKETELICFLNP